MTQRCQHNSHLFYVNKVQENLTVGTPILYGYAAVIWGQLGQ